MIKKIKNKLQSKEGGLKELLYDNIGIFIVGVLIVVTIFAAGNSVTSRGGKNTKNITEIETNIRNKGFSTSTPIDAP